MADEVLKRDQNTITVLGGITDDSNQFVTMLRVDPITKRLLVSATGVGSGTVTSVSVVTANGISGSVATATTTPAITLDISGLDATKIANGTVTSTEFQYLDGVTSAIQTQINTKQATLSGASLTAVTVATDDKVLIQDTSDSNNLKTVTVSSIVALASGGITIGTTAITSGTTTRILYDNAGVVGEYTLTGSGTVVVMATSPTLVTPVLGIATATSINKITLTQPANGSTLTLIDGKTLTINKTISFTAADDTGIYTLPTGTKTLLATDGAGTSLTGIPYTLTGTANQVVLSAGTGNITFSLPQSIATSSNPQFATIELGAASDTTLARVSAGVVSIEGVNILTTATGLPLSGGTMTGNITLGENTAIALDPAGSADGKYTGITITGTAGYAQTYGDLVYLAVADSRWEKTDADALATAGNVLIGIVVVAGAADGSACTILLQGQIRADAAFPALTVGAGVFVGETAGAIQVAIPTGADNVIRVVGFALTADEIYFNPSQDWQTSVA